MQPVEFEAVVESMNDVGSWARVFVPLDIPALFGGRARTPIKGTADGFTFAASLFPEGDGRFYLYVNKAMREATGKGPDDLAQVLDGDETAGAAWQTLSVSCRQEYVDWIVQAKKPETRQRRLEKALPMIAARQRLKS